MTGKCIEKCHNCGCDIKEPFDKMMDRVLRESGERMKKEMGYGIPDENEFKKHYAEDLGSVITGEWRKGDTKKDN